jgi:hypothetical protein
VLQIIYTHVDQIMFVMSLSPWSDKEEKEKNKNICFHHVDLSTWHDRSPWHTDIITCTPSIVWTWPFGFGVWFRCLLSLFCQPPNWLSINPTKPSDWSNQSSIKIICLFLFHFRLLNYSIIKPTWEAMKERPKEVTNFSSFQ